MHLFLLLVVFDVKNIRGPPRGWREGVIGLFFGREGVIAKKNGREGVIEETKA